MVQKRGALRVSRCSFEDVQVFLAQEGSLQTVAGIIPSKVHGQLVRALDAREAAVPGTIRTVRSSSRSERMTSSMRLGRGRGIRERDPPGCDSARTHMHRLTTVLQLVGNYTPATLADFPGAQSSFTVREVGNWRAGLDLGQKDVLS
jgi:hypothetical protein